MSKSTQKITVQDIIAALELELPGEKAHRLMLPEGRTLDIPFGKTIKESAVLIPLFFKNEILFICLTRRNKNLKHHPGQISFPGGQKEKQEQTFEETALREMEEETGIKKEQIELLGELSTIYIPVSNFLIHPFIGYLENEPTFSVDHNEVDEIITIPMKIFLDPENKTTSPINTITGMLNVPCYKINEQIIWGATAMIIAEITTLLENYGLREEKYSGNGSNNSAHQKRS
ncbi:MAG TPA: CoA pyrophosphatase [Prolixibacteraceae bacterium]|nr:CoA pyrophosphatase [Prolixibacteraceae bacterium]